MKFSAAEAASVWKIAAPGDFILDGAAVDSRRVRPGNLFVALPGARVDGHDFVADAFARGAAAAVVGRQPVGPAAGPLFVVPDPLESLQRLASARRRQAAFRLAAVTGSAGKTTTKELTAAILATKFRSGRTAGNFNSAIGFPMTLLNLDDGLEAVAGEMGMSRAGELSTLSRLFSPDAAAITNVSEAHRQFFDSVEAIADAKWEIVDGLKPGATLVFNADDERLVRRARGFAGHKTSFGFSPEADVRGDAVEAHGASGTTFTLHMKGESIPVALTLAGRHQVANCLCAAALAGCFGIAAADVAQAAARFNAPARRGGIFLLASGALLVDDSYNASPAAMRAAIEALHEMPARRRVAVFGEMLELGPDGPERHREIGRLAAGRVDLLICVGPLARHIAQGARDAGLSPSAIVCLDSATEVASALSPLLSEGDVVWIKGSRAVALDAAADALKS